MTPPPETPETAIVDTARDFWVFAYGSLMWNPGFEPAEAVLARLDDYHRSFCMASIVYRGTPEDPGLVLALDTAPGDSCTGVGYRIPAAIAPTVLDYLRDRELVSSAYREVIETITLTDGRRIAAVCYVMDRDHHQYRGTLTPVEQADIIARAAGPAGPNRDYLFNTVKSLRHLGLEDADLFDLADRVRRMG